MCGLVLIVGYAIRVLRWGLCTPSRGTACPQSDMHPTQVWGDVCAPGTESQSPGRCQPRPWCAASSGRTTFQTYWLQLLDRNSGLRTAWGGRQAAWAFPAAKVRRRGSPEIPTTPSSGRKQNPVSRGEGTDSTSPPGVPAPSDRRASPMKSGGREVVPGGRGPLPAWPVSGELLAAREP